MASFHPQKAQTHDSWGKLANETNHIDELCVWLKDSVSKNKIEDSGHQHTSLRLLRAHELSCVHSWTHAHTYTQTQTHTHTYTHSTHKYTWNEEKEKQNNKAISQSNKQRKKSNHNSLQILSLLRLTSFNNNMNLSNLVFLLLDSSFIIFQNTYTIWIGHSLVRYLCPREVLVAFIFWLWINHL